MVSGSGRRTIFTHTEVDPSMQGQGIAQELARQAKARRSADGQQRPAGRTAVPVHRVVRVHRHPEYADLV